jgi:hypothetical protein
MDSVRPQRERKKRTIWEASPSGSVRPSQITKKKARRTVKNEALKPIAAKPIIHPEVLNQNLPTYVPPRKLHYISGRPAVRGSTELKTFQKLISDDVVDIIVAATNSYAERQRKLDEITLYSRLWKDITRAEI